MVTVTAAQLPGAIGDKLAAATQACHELREAEKPKMTQIHDPSRRLAQCIAATRGIALTIQTFAQPVIGQTAFWAWVNKWEKGLAAADLKLWKEMRIARNEQEHGAGSDLIPVLIPVDNDPSITVFTGGPLFPNMRPRDGNASKGGVRFRQYPNQPASEVCADYISLMRRFADDFRRDHAAHL